MTMNPTDDYLTFPYGRYKTGTDTFIDARREIVEPLLDPTRPVPIVDITKIFDTYAPIMPSRRIGECRIVATEAGLTAVDLRLAPGAKIVGDLAPVFTVDNRCRVTGLLEVFFTPTRLLPEST